MNGLTPASGKEAGVTPSAPIFLFRKPASQKHTKRISTSIVKLKKTTNHERIVFELESVEGFKFKIFQFKEGK